MVAKKRAANSGGHDKGQSRQEEENTLQDHILRPVFELMFPNKKMTLRSYRPLTR